MPRADDSLIESLVRFVGSADFHIVGQDAKRDAKRLLLDAIASGFAGRTSPETPVIDGAMRRSMGNGTSTVIGGTRSSPAAAAAINGYLITARSLCDVHRPTLCHVTPVVVPAALAMAESADADGATFMGGLTAGMELTVRVGYALRYEEFRRRGWHTPGVAGPFGSAAAAARIARLEPDQIANAMGIAGSQAGGTFASFGTPTMKFHQARAAMAGLLAAELAAHGLRGNPEILTAEDGGILNTFTDGGDRTALTGGLGEQWRLREISTRLWPVAAALQSVTAAVLEMRDGRPEEVMSIQVDLPPASYEMNAEMTWEDTFHATLSARWVTAVSLVDGQCWLEQFEPKRLNDQRVGAIATDHVEVQLDPSLPEGGCRVVFTMRDGRALTDLRLHPRGDPNDPATQQEVEEKLRRAARGVIDDGAAESIIELVDNIEQISNIRELTTLLSTQ